MPNLLETINKLIDSNFYGTKATTILKSDNFFSMEERATRKRSDVGTFTFLDACNEIIQSGTDSSENIKVRSNGFLFASASYALIGDLHGRGDMLIRNLYHGGLLLGDGSLNQALLNILRSQKRTINIYILGDMVDTGFDPHTIAIIDGLKNMFDNSGVVKIHPIIGNHDYGLVERLNQPEPGNPLSGEKRLAAQMLTENIKRGEYKLLEYDDNLKLISHAPVEKGFIIQVFAQLLRSKRDRSKSAKRIYEVNDELNNIYTALTDQSIPQSLGDINSMSYDELSRIMEEKNISLKDIVDYANKKFCEDVKKGCNKKNLPSAYRELKLVEFRNQRVRTGVGDQSINFIQDVQSIIGGPLYSTKKPRLQLQMEDTISNIARSILLSLVSEKKSDKLEEIQKFYDSNGKTYDVTCYILNKPENSDIKEEFISRIKVFASSKDELPPDINSIFIRFSRIQFDDMIIESLNQNQPTQYVINKLKNSDGFEVKNWIGHFPFGRREILGLLQTVPSVNQRKVSIFKRYNKTLGTDCKISEGIAGFIMIGADGTVFDIHSMRNQITGNGIEEYTKNPTISLSRLAPHNDGDWTTIEIGKLSLESTLQNDKGESSRLKIQEKNKKFTHMMMVMIVGSIATFGLTVGMVAGISGSRQAFSQLMSGITAGDPFSKGVIIASAGIFLLTALSFSIFTMKATLNGDYNASRFIPKDHIKPNLNHEPSVGVDVKPNYEPVNIRSSGKNHESKLPEEDDKLPDSGIILGD